MNTKRNIRLNGECLKRAVKRKGLSYRQFAMDCQDWLLRIGKIKRLPEDIGDREKAASSWFSLLCRPDDDPRKTGVDPDLLKWIVWIKLDVRKDYLTGDDPDAPMTNEDVVQRLEEKKKKDESKVVGQILSNHVALKKSPAYSLIKDRLDVLSLIAVDGNTWFSMTFKDNPEARYTISPEELKTIETACSDLICSLIRINAAKHEDVTQWARENEQSKKTSTS